MRVEGEMQEYDVERGRVRVNYAAHALVKSNTRKWTEEGTVRDISMHSMYLYIEPVFEIGERLEIRVNLYGVDSKLTIEFPAEVARIDEDGLAVRFYERLEWWPVFTLFPTYRLDKNSRSPFTLGSSEHG
jgi:hypothetical protein